MFKYLFLFTFIFVSNLLQAQDGWNWPEDPDLKSKALERQAYYKLLIAKSDYSAAIEPLNWLYTNVPNLNQSIYIEGVDVIKNVLKNVKSEEREQKLQDSILWMYERRMEYFDNDAATIDRMAFEAFKLYYKEQSKFPLLADLFEKAFNMNGPEISNFNLNLYMLLAKNYHQVSPDKMPAAKVLDIHSTISEIIETKIGNGEDRDKLEKEQSKVDAFLSSIPGILSCDFIENQLVPKFRANPTDLNTAKKIFKYSLEAKCTDQPYFLEASEPVFKEQPSYTLASALGNKYLASGDANKGLEYHTQALKYAGNNDEKFNAYMGQAIAYSKVGNKSKARALAYEALSAKPGSSDAYNLIGNLYFTSYESCKEGKSQVMDRSVFLAAFKMYEKAGNKSQMNASKEQFPSIEDIFNEGLEEGDNLTVGCWINETVKLQRR